MVKLEGQFTLQETSLGKVHNSQQGLDRIKRRYEVIVTISFAIRIFSNKESIAFPL